MARNLAVSTSRVAADIDALAAITEPGHPYTRRAFTPKFLEGRSWLKQRFEQAGLSTRIDAAGNLIGTRKGRRAGLGTIMLGSHSDTVPDGGRFDGIAGIVAALEVARALNEHGIDLDHDLEIVDFLAEEVSIFGVSCIGSRGMVGLLPADWFDRATDGLTLRAGIAETGGTPDAIAAEARTDIKAFLELHIEQGPVLENEKRDIGIVTAIAGITRLEIVVQGHADHAGTTPMGLRYDALAAAAELVLGIEALARRLALGEAHFAATVGEFRIEPNAANVVPSTAALLIDARAELRQDMEHFIEALNELVDRIAGKREIAISAPRKISDNVPTPSDPDLLDILEMACSANGAQYRRMASGAGHDTAWLAKVTKAAMIFVPCQGGRSHAPEEFARIDDIALGAAVLLDTVKRLDHALQEER